MSDSLSLTLCILQVFCEAIFLHIHMLCESVISNASDTGHQVSTHVWSLS